MRVLTVACVCVLLLVAPVWAQDDYVELTRVDMDLQTFINLPIQGDTDNDGVEETILGRILYGNDGVEFSLNANGTNAKILDITGDGVAEILVLSRTSPDRYSLTSEAFQMWQVTVYYNPAATASNTEGQTELPSYQLSQNFPNPLNPSTQIPYTLREPAEPVIRIYNGLGQVVRTLEPGLQASGTYRLGWDARDQAGTKVASGTYFYELQVGNRADVRKMVVVR